MPIHPGFARSQFFGPGKLFHVEQFGVGLDGRKKDKGKSRSFGFAQDDILFPSKVAGAEKRQRQGACLVTDCSTWNNLGVLACKLVQNQLFHVEQSRLKCEIWLPNGDYLGLNGNFVSFP